MDLWLLWTPNHHPFSWHINTSLELSIAALGFEPTDIGVWGQRSASYTTADCVSLYTIKKNVRSILLKNSSFKMTPAVAYEFPKTVRYQPLCSVFHCSSATRAWLFSLHFLPFRYILCWKNSCNFPCKFHKLLFEFFMHWSCSSSYYLRLLLLLLLLFVFLPISGICRTQRICGLIESIQFFISCPYVYLWGHSNNLNSIWTIIQNML